MVTEKGHCEGWIRLRWIPFEESFEDGPPPSRKQIHGSRIRFLRDEGKGQKYAHCEGMRKDFQREKKKKESDRKK